MEMKNLARAIKTERQKQGLTLQDISDKTGLSTALLSMIETGQRNVTIKTLSIFQEALGVDIFAVFDLPLLPDEWRLLEAWRMGNIPVICELLAERIGEIPPIE